MLNEQLNAEKSYWTTHLSARLDDKSFDKIVAIVLNSISASSRLGLELGCGEGRLIERLQGLIGIDYSCLGLSNCIKRDTILACADACKLPFNDETFDYVVTNSMHHMPYRETIGEVYRVLRPGGVFICIEPNRWHLYNLLFSAEGGEIIVGDRGFFPSDIEKYFSVSGFECLPYKYVQLNMDKKRLLTRLQRIAQMLPTRFFQAWFVVRAFKNTKKNINEKIGNIDYSAL